MREKLEILTKTKNSKVFEQTLCELLADIVDILEPEEVKEEDIVEISPPEDTGSLGAPSDNELSEAITTASDEEEKEEDDKDQIEPDTES